MKITKNNYEVYFIDYFDGNLSAEIEESLHLFLAKNPDLKQEFEEFQNFNLSEITTSNLTDEKIDFSELKKEALIHSANEDEFYIGFIENDLTDIEKTELSLYVSKNKERKEKLDSYSKTKLEIPFIPYPNKKELKKSGRKPIFYYATLLAAACFIGFVMVQNYTKISPNETIENPVLVKNNPDIDSLNNNIIISYIDSVFELKNYRIEKKVKPSPKRNKFIEKKPKNRFIAQSKGSTPKIPIYNNREEKISFEKMNPRKMNLAFVSDTKLKDFTPFKEKNTNPKKPNITESNTYTLLGYAKHKTTSFVKKKTGFDVSSRESISALVNDSKNKLDEKTGYKKKQNIFNKILSYRKLTLYSAKN